MQINGNLFNIEMLTITILSYHMETSLRTNSCTHITTCLVSTTNPLIKGFSGIGKILKNFVRALLPLLLIGLIPLSSSAIDSSEEIFIPSSTEEITISGKVTDEEGQEIVGATIQVKGTSRGTITDMEGNYSITVSEGETLVFSYVGYRTIEVVVTDQEEINLVLELDERVLDELVVVGYGTQSRVNLTGSVQTANFDEATNQPASTSSQLLYGRFSGVQLTQTSGSPGADGANIVIRGVGTFGNSSPLIVIDNIQYDNLAAFNNLAPSDIESITVLKDAASTSIYGARGANGVVLVTTRRGSDEFKINYNNYIGIQSVTVQPDFLDAYTYAILMNEKFRNEGGPDFDPRYSEEQLEAIRTGSMPDQFANTNWADEVLTTAPMTNHSLTISGGGDRTTFRVSAGYLSQDAVVRSSFRSQRYNLGFNINSQVRDWFNVSHVTNAFWRRNEGPTGGQGAFDGDNGIIFALQRTAPTIPVYYSNGEFGVADGAWIDGNNPSLITQNPLRRGQLGEFESDNVNISTRTGLRFDISDRFSFETSGSANIIYNNSSDFNPTQLQNDWEGRIVIRNEVNSLTNSTNLDYTLRNENIFRYNQEIFQNHTIDALLGHSISFGKIDPFSATVRGFATNEFREINAGGTEFSASGGANEDAQQSFFTRVTYDYDEKYLAELNYRIDGSSRFGPDNRYGHFPSGSVGWRLSEEDFLREIDAINELKLRLSWGITGNDRITRYGFQTLLGYNQDYFLGNSAVLGSGINRLGNPTIKWEESEQLNLGLDLTLFNNQLEIVADYFHRNSKNILYDNFPVPRTLGVTNLVAENAASMVSEGIEFGTRYRGGSNNYNFSVGADITKFLTRSEVTGLGPGGEETISAFDIIRVGAPFRAYYGYKAIGIFQDFAEIADAPNQFSGNTAPGDIRYADINGDGVVDENDRTVIGNPNPNWLVNFNGSFNYKWFDVSVLFQGVIGIDRLLMGNGNLPMPDNRSNVLTKWEDRWTPENPSTTLPRVGGRDNDLVSSFYIEDGSYLRLKNLEVGYTLSSDITQRINVNRFRIFVGAQNILTFTGLENFDPEGGSGRFSNRNAPLYKTFTFGINLNL